MSYYYDDSHKNECENAEYYYCKDCRELVHESQKNLCPTCLLFIPRVTGCICDNLPEYEPDYDTINKAKMESVLA